MKSRQIQFATIILIVSLHCVLGKDLRRERRVAGESNWDRFMQHLEPALKSAGRVGRLYYRADCWTERGDGIFFPQLELNAPSKSETGLAAVKEIFRKTTRATITGGPSAITRISIGNVSHALLNTKIRVLTLEPSERYNARDVIWAIQRTKEVEAKMRELGLEEAPVVFSGPMAVPAPGLPHLPVIMKDVTMDEALDRVAQTFGGLVTYAECISAHGTRLVFVNFDYISDGKDGAMSRGAR